MRAAVAGSMDTKWSKLCTLLSFFCALLSVVSWGSTAGFCGIVCGIGPLKSTGLMLVRQGGIFWCDGGEGLVAVFICVGTVCCAAMSFTALLQSPKCGKNHCPIPPTPPVCIGQDICPGKWPPPNILEVNQQMVQFPNGPFECTTANG